MKTTLSKISWILYDFANSAYHLLIITVLFPICFKKGLYAHLSNSDALWSIFISIPILLSGIIAPFIGAYIDRTKKKTIFFVVTCILTAIMTTLLGFIPFTLPSIAVFTFCLSVLFFNLSQFVYNAFLPTQINQKGLATLSGTGWGVGYLGGILCMPIVFAFIKESSLPADYNNYQTSFIIVALYYILFSIPSLLFMKDQYSNDLGQTSTDNPIKTVFKTLSNWSQNKEIFKFLFAFYLINDGLSTLVFFTSIFASSTLKMSTSEIMKAFLIVQAVGIPSTIALCWISERIGYKKVLMGTVILWIFNSIAFLVVKSAFDLYILSISVGLVIGTTPALARAILALMIDKDNISEIYGLHALTGRISSIFGPLLFGIVSSVTNNQTIAMSSLLLFFICGLIVLKNIDIVNFTKEDQVSNT